MECAYREYIEELFVHYILCVRREDSYRAIDGRLLVRADECVWVCGCVLEKHVAFAYVDVWLAYGWAPR